MEFFSHTYVIVEKKCPYIYISASLFGSNVCRYFLFLFFRKELVKSMLCIQLNGMQKVAVFTQLQDFIWLGEMSG